MTLKCNPARSFCTLNEFKINGINADYTDFGDKEDLDPAKASSYGCGDLQFVPKPPENIVLEKYKITKDDYNKVCEKLKRALSFGRCDWCV